MKKIATLFLSLSLLIGVFFLNKKSSESIFFANVEALAQSEGGSLGPMCSKTGNTGDYYMKLCSNCDGIFGHYAMDIIAFCENS